MANLATSIAGSGRSRFIGVVVVVVAAGALVGGLCGSGRCRRNRRGASGVSSNAVSNQNQTTSAVGVNGTSIFPAPPTLLANSSLSPATQNTTRAPVDLSSRAPTTEIPSSQVPITTDPVTVSPIMKARVTESPTNNPTTNTPTTKAPITEAPMTRAPMTRAPTTNAPTTESPTIPTPVTNPPTAAPTETELTGALITNDCQFLDYSYAIDIYWSCGEERFQQPLRLHTFKRHSRSHRFVFADQRITYRSQQLWFDGYTVPRCVRISGGEWRLASNDCSRFRLLDSPRGFVVQDVATSLCAVTTFCNDDASTGGSECGGLDHRFLPLRMGSCNTDALTFSFAPVAEVCANERPGNACF